MNASPFPNPTVKEIDTLALHIVNWHIRSELQQSICLAVLRGHKYVPKIARVLGRSAADVEAAVHDLIGQGLLWDNHKLLIR